MGFGAKIQKIRELRGYTQESIAFELGISQSAYCHLEKDHTSISLEKLLKIVNFLDVSLDQLLNFDENNILSNEYVQLNQKEGFSLQDQQLIEERVSKLEDDLKQLRDSISKKDRR